jgi:hypothetical protein
MFGLGLRQRCIWRWERPTCARASRDCTDWCVIGFCVSQSLVICSYFPTRGAIGSKCFIGTAVDCGYVRRQTLHNARCGYLRVVYRYHPYFGQTFEVFGSAGGLRDLVYVRMPNDATRGIPAWMFDETICGSIRCADRPTIDCQALLRLALLLDLQDSSRSIGRHESSSAQSKIASKASPSPNVTGDGEVASKRSNPKRGPK